jgi:uncharacterized protein (TIGR02145 family)
MKTNLLFPIFLSATGLLVITATCRKDLTNQNTVIDVDGNVYKTITIGSQIWMAENLRVTHYNNGDVIPYLEEANAGTSKTTGYLTDYEFNYDYSLEHGHLYDGLVITDSRGICPKGWHVPTASDWEILIAQLGGPKIAGASFCAQGARPLSEQSPDDFTATSFNAIFSGFYDECGLFLGMGQATYFWSSSISRSGEQGYVYTSYINYDIGIEWDSPLNKFSVRLVRN